MTFWRKFLNMDRRIMWGAMFLIVAAVLLRPIGLPMQIGSTTEKFYDFVEDIPRGSIVWVEAGFGAGNLPEVGPQIRTFLIQAYRRDLRLIMSSTGVEGSQLGQEMFEDIKSQFFPDLEYGVDFLNVGYRPGTMIYARALADDVMSATGGVDIFGRSLADFPLASEVPRLHGDYVAVLAHFVGHDPPPDEWFAAVGQPGNIPIISGTPQMAVPQFIPFLEAGIIKANIPGMRGAAEYESLVGVLGSATAGQDVTSSMVLFITILVIMANVGYILTRKDTSS